MGQNDGYGFTPPPPNALNQGQGMPMGAMHPAMGMQHFMEGMKQGFGAGVQHVLQQLAPPPMPMQQGHPQQMSQGMQPGQPPNVPQQGPY